MATIQHRVNTVEGAIVLLTNLLDKQDERLEELQRTTQQFQRIWVWLAKKEGWPGDGEAGG